MKSWTTHNNLKVIRLLSGRSNVFLVAGNDIVILIDTSPGRLWSRLKKRLAELNIKSIDYLILTHAHYDHAENAARIKKEFKAQVIVNNIEALYLEKGENALTSGTNFFTRFMVNTFTPFLNDFAKYEPCKADLLVDEVMDMNLKDLDIKIIRTPGHTDGSQSIIVDNEIVLAGDTMFGVFPRSVLPPFSLDKNKLLNSWKLLYQTGCRLFMPSHGGERTRELLGKEITRFARNPGDNSIFN